MKNTHKSEELYLLIGVLIILGLLCLIPVFSNAQGTSSEEVKPKQVTQTKAAPKPDASILTTEEANNWVKLQNQIGVSKDQLEKLIATANLAEPKTKDEKANLWADFETVMLRSKIEADSLTALETKLKDKYKCEGCEIKIAPDQKSVVIKPKAVNGPSIGQ